MQSRVCSSVQLHQRRQTAALVTRLEADRRAFLDGLLQDADLCGQARRAFLAQLQRQEATPPLLALAAEDAAMTVLRAAFRRLDDLLKWNPAQGPLATWWGLQALFEFNTDGRRQAERLCGYWRGTDETFLLGGLGFTDATGEWQPTELSDGTDHVAETYERRAAAGILGDVLAGAQDVQARGWLREWLAADALADEPLSWQAAGIKLNWRYGAQTRLAQQAGVSERTMRKRAVRVEALLWVSAPAQAI